MSSQSKKMAAEPQQQSRPHQSKVRTPHNQAAHTSSSEDVSERKANTMQQATQQPLLLPYSLLTTAAFVVTQRGWKADITAAGRRGFDLNMETTTGGSPLARRGVTGGFGNEFETVSVRHAWWRNRWHHWFHVPVKTGNLAPDADACLSCGGCAGGCVVEISLLSHANDRT